MRDTTKSRRPPRNQSLERGLAVLEAFGARRAEIGIRELGRLLNLNKTIVHRLARTLLERGFLEQNPDTLRYAIGPRAFEVGQRYSIASGPAEAALPVLQRLADHGQLNAYLGVLRGASIVYLLTLQSSGPIVIRAKPGSPAHVHSTALGKVLLGAHRDPAALLGTKPLLRLTPSTLTDPGMVLAELKTVRAQGHAISDEENLPGVWAVGAPVVDRTGQVVAAISGACPRYQVTKVRAAEIVRAVRAAALQISKSLGAPAALSRQSVATR
jgi:DNA-binding IclR family transcriptional regulator